MILLPLLLVSAAACSARRGPRIEVITVEQQALEEVARTPLTFVVPLLKDEASWERARSFFDLYLGSSPERREPYSVGEYLMTNSGRGAGRYIYEVERVPEREGMRYTVSCFVHGPDGDAVLAERNARNLARFIKDGTLERSLLHR